MRLQFGVLVSLALFLSACQEPDIGPDPTLSDIKISDLYLPPEAIAKLGKSVAARRGVNGTVLALAQLNRETRTCLIVLPVTDDAALLERLRRHEVRHCRGEEHGRRSRFSDEYSFASHEGDAPEARPPALEPSGVQAP